MLLKQIGKPRVNSEVLTPSPKLFVVPGCLITPAEDLNKRILMERHDNLAVVKNTMDSLAVSNTLN